MVSAALTHFEALRTSSSHRAEHVLGFVGVGILEVGVMQTQPSPPKFHWKIWRFCGERRQLH